MLYALFVIVGRLFDIIQTVVIVQFILSLLISFNVINLHNNGVAAIWRGLNAILDPLLAPIRKILPDTSPMDFSPMALLFGLWALKQLIFGAGQSLGVFQ